MSDSKTSSSICISTYGIKPPKPKYNANIYINDKVYVRKVRKGINNPVSLCYMSSAIHLLLDMPEILNIYSNSKWIIRQGDTIIDMNKLLHNMRTIYNNNDTHTYKDSKEFCLNNNKSKQQDTQEWLMLILDTIRGNSLSNYLQFTIKRTPEYVNGLGDTLPHRNESFIIIDPAYITGAIEDTFDKLSEPYEVELSGDKRVMRQTYDLQDTKYIIFHVSRLQVGNKQNMREFDQKELNITKKKTVQFNNISYKLSGAVVHSGFKTGTQSSGHYVYYQFIDNKIILYDDSKMNIVNNHQRDYNNHITKLNTHAILILYQKADGALIDKQEMNITTGGCVNYKINKKAYIKLNTLTRQTFRSRTHISDTCGNL